MELSAHATGDCPGANRTPLPGVNYPVFTAADYLAWESVQLERHAFLDGEVSAMAGVEDRKVRTADNLYIPLRQHLRGGPCRTCMSDMRLHLSAANGYFYPDVLVTCSALDLGSALVKTEPRLIAEVLSPGTAAYGRGPKFSQGSTAGCGSHFDLIKVRRRSP